MSTALGRCPICAEELEQEGNLLVCPAGDYKVKISRFLGRWQEFDELLATRKQAGESITSQDTDSLMRDLQEMKEKT